MQNPFEVLNARLTNIEALLAELAAAEQQPRNNPKANKLLSIDEASEFLSLAKPTLYRLTSTRAIPFLKPAGSKKLYFKLADLEAWANAGRKKTVSEISADASKSLKIRK